MAFETVFTTIEKDELSDLVARLSSEGQRFVQILAVNTEDGIDLVYSFMQGDTLTNYEIKGVGKDDAIPSITEFFLEAFVFENEIHDLFGVQIDDIEIDFGGNFYRLAIDEPMTIISPEKKARLEKARKAEAAKAKAARKDQAGKGASEDSDEELERKLAAMPPEKAAKVRAAMKAKAAREETAQEKASKAKDDEFERKLAAMPPEKAAKVRAAMDAKKKKAEKGGDEA